MRVVSIRVVAEARPPTSSRTASHDIVGREVAHAAVMALGADRPLAGAAGDRLEEWSAAG